MTYTLPEALILLVPRSQITADRLAGAAYMQSPRLVPV